RRSSTRSALFPYTTLFRSDQRIQTVKRWSGHGMTPLPCGWSGRRGDCRSVQGLAVFRQPGQGDLFPFAQVGCRAVIEALDHQRRAAGGFKVVADEFADVVAVEDRKSVVYGKSGDFCVVGIHGETE